MIVIIENDKNLFQNRIASCKREILARPSDFKQNF